MTRMHPTLRVRLPQDLIDRIAEKAKANGRSSTAEFLLAVKSHLGVTDDAEVDRITRLEEQMYEVRDVLGLGS